MAVAADDFTKPGGRLNPKICWPGLSPGDIGEKLGGFLEDAAVQVAAHVPALTTATAQDAATTEWVVGRTWDEIADELVRFASSRAPVDEGSFSWTQGQVDAARAKATAAFAAFAAVEDVTEEPEVIAPPRVASHQSAIRFVW